MSLKSWSWCHWSSVTTVGRVVCSCAAQQVAEGAGRVRVHIPLVLKMDVLWQQMLFLEEWSCFCHLKKLQTSWHLKLNTKTHYDSVFMLLTGLATSGLSSVSWLTALHNEARLSLQCCSLQSKRLKPLLCVSLILKPKMKRHQSCLSAVITLPLFLFGL